VLSLDEMCNGRQWMANIRQSLEFGKTKFLLVKVFEFQKEGRM